MSGALHISCNFYSVKFSFRQIALTISRCYTLNIDISLNNFFRNRGFLFLICNSEMFCTKTLSQSLQLAYAFNFQIIEIIIKSYIPIFVNRIHIVEFAITIREKHQIEHFKIIEKNVYKAQTLWVGIIAYRALTNLAFRALFVTIDNPYKFGQNKVSLIQHFCKNRLKRLQFQSSRPFFRTFFQCSSPVFYTFADFACNQRYILHIKFFVIILICYFRNCTFCFLQNAQSTLFSLSKINFLHNITSNLLLQRDCFFRGIS